MGTILLNIALKLLTSDAVKTLIALGVNKLLEHSKDGITKDLTITLLDGIAKSKANPVTSDILKDAVKLLDK